MKKIFFAPTVNISSEKFQEEFAMQTPKQSGIWKNISSTNNSAEADYLIIQDYTNDNSLIEKFPKKKIIYFSREALDRNIFFKYKKKKLNMFSFWNKSGYLFTKWIYSKAIKKNFFQRTSPFQGLMKNYDELKNIKPHKKKKLCSILSNKKYNEGHITRIDFTKKFLENYKFDLYGTIKFKNSDMKKYNENKYKVLKNYKYCLGFDNQDSIDNFFGTQFTDAILSWCVPIFWCGTNLGKFFPQNSFIQFNARKPEIEIERIIKILDKDDYNKRLPDLKKARDLILNKYNFWPTVESIISKNK